MIYGHHVGILGPMNTRRERPGMQIAVCLCQGLERPWLWARHAGTHDTLRDMSHPSLPNLLGSQPSQILTELRSK